MAPIIEIFFIWEMTKSELTIYSIDEHFRGKTLDEDESNPLLTVDSESVVDEKKEFQFRCLNNNILEGILVNHNLFNSPTIHFPVCLITKLKDIENIDIVFESKTCGVNFWDL